MSLTKPGRSGLEEIQKTMTLLRSNSPQEIAGHAVAEVMDYQQQTRRNLQSGRIEALTLPKSNVIQLLMANGDRITARPSGTEPKIKYYFNTTGVRLERGNLTMHYQEVRQELKERVESYRRVLSTY